MAKIYTKSNSLTKKFIKYRLMAAGGITLAVFCAAFLIMNLFEQYISNKILIGIIFCIIPSGIIFTKIMISKGDIVKSGILGEKSTRKLIKKFPREYTGIANVIAEHDGEISELDMVVVGKTGVYVIETKNQVGLIQGSADDKHLVRTKTIQDGETHTDKLYNPIRQVGTHVYRLSHYLKEKDIKVHVQGIVYFSNQYADIQIIGNDDKIPFFSKLDDGEKNLYDYIVNNTESKKLSKETVKEIINALR